MSTLEVVAILDRMTVEERSEIAAHFGFFPPPDFSSEEMAQIESACDEGWKDALAGNVVSAGDLLARLRK